MKTPSLAGVAACAAATVCIVFLCLQPGTSSAAQAATDAVQIVQAMKAEFDRPEQPLSVNPVSVEGGFAIAGWAQGDSGGRALLQRMGNQWQIVLCAGDALLQPATLSGAGMARDAAHRLVSNVRTAESRLPAARREQFTRFAGVVQVANPASLHVSSAWARATPAGGPVGAVYFTLVNHGKHPDTLLSLQSPAATTVAMHRTSVEGGVSSMRPAEQIVIAPGQTMKAEPGGLHVMLLGLKSPLAAGTSVPLVLTFRHAGAITVQVKVQAATAAAPAANTSH